MLEKGFFNVKPFNPNPYLDPVIVDLSGAQKFEDNTVFMAGRYRIEVAPGARYTANNSLLSTYQTSFNVVEEITQPFIVRAYCGSDGSNGSVGTNLYSGSFKVNGITTATQANGIDVSHIFGAGGGNGRGGSFVGILNGGGNCLGNGAYVASPYTISAAWGGAGSCLHIIPIGGTFGTDYLRAYHTSPYANICGGAYGGGAAGKGDNYWYRGGNSPYGNGGISAGDAGSGVGGGGKTVTYTEEGQTRTAIVAGGAYFDGTNWIDSPGDPLNTIHSIIRITYLGPLV